MELEEVDESFTYERRVAFHDTDAMGVTHHANYLKILEEARVAWMRARNLSHTHFPQCDRVMALLHYQVWHLRPSTFEDLLKVQLQARRVGARLQYQYVIYKRNPKDQNHERIAEAVTTHIPVDQNLRPIRMTSEMQAALENEKWIETWLSNS